MEKKEGGMNDGQGTISGSTGVHQISTIPHSPSVQARDEAMNIEDASEFDGIPLAEEELPNEDTEDIIAFSIGQEQLRMKSPATPAFEKVRALHESESYFDLGPEVGDGNGDEGDADHDANIPSDGLRERSTDIAQPQAPSSRAFREDLSQPVTSRSILRDGLGSSTRRASSGSNGMVGTLKRLLPDLPSISFLKPPAFPTFGLGSRSNGEDLASRRKKSTSLFIRSNLPWVSTNQATERRLTITDSPIERDHSPSHPPVHDNGTLYAQREEIDSRLSSCEPRLLSRQTTKDRHHLRRATSDGSLFIRADLERATTQDDAEKWAHVSEHLNSRFKAITDSFQDSAISRIPRLSNVNLGSLIIQRSDVDAARSKTGRGRANTQQDDVTMRKSGPQDTLSSYSFTTSKHTHPTLSQATSQLTGDVVVLGGYRGSILRSAKPPNKQLWVPVKVGINLRRVDLEVGLKPEDEEKMTDTIIPSGVLSHIGPVDICRRLLKHLQKSSRSRPDEFRVHDYGYDWRLSPHFLSQQLIKFLESLECNRPDVTGRARGATVIAHSLGGMITRHAVNQRPDLFSGIIYAGVPQHCINILGPLRKGDDVLLSSRVLTAQVNFTLRTSYLFLPESGKCFIDKTTGERYDLDFFDVKTWEEHCLSPCVSSSAPSTRLEQRKGIISTLSESLPSLPLTSKRNSIVRQDSSSAPESRLSLEDAKGAVKDSANHTAHKTEEAFSAPHAQPIEPSMGSLSSTIRETAAAACTMPRAEAIEYLDRTLKSVRQFKHEMAFNPSHQAADIYPPIAVLYCNSVPTVFGARVDSREAIKGAEAYDSLAFAAGDGIVLSKSARPPDGYKVVRGGLVKSEKGHIGLLGDLEAVGKCLQAIVNARRRGVGTGMFAENA